MRSHTVSSETLFLALILPIAGSVDVGLAVGLSLGLLFFICILGAIGGFVFYCSRKRQPPQTGAAETISATGIATTENTPAGSPTYPPRSSPTIYPTQASPVASYPPQPNAQLSYGVPPPSYDVPTSNYYTTGVRIELVCQGLSTCSGYNSLTAALASDLYIM